MFDLFDFDLPGAVTEQLERRLNSMPSSTLTEQALQHLGEFLEQHKLRQGVYQILLKDEVVYVGKAANAKERLEQHYWKVRGRRNIDMLDIRFRCLVLHPNWSTSAHEDLLIDHYKAQGQAKWNGAGFGPKDVGSGRDDTEPSRFDRQHPINDDYPCGPVPDCLAVGSLAKLLKSQLPFTFRYQISKGDAARPVDLVGVPRQARDLIQRLVTTLGPGWQATIFPSHIILYKERRSYQFGEVIALQG